MWVLFFIIIGVIWWFIAWSIEQERQRARDRAAREVLGNILYETEREAIYSIGSWAKNTTISLCPVCGGILKMRMGMYGDFWGCSNYPRCRFTKKIIKQY